MGLHIAIPMCDIRDVRSCHKRKKWIYTILILVYYYNFLELLLFVTFLCQTFSFDVGPLTVKCEYDAFHGSTWNRGVEICCNSFLMPARVQTNLCHRNYSHETILGKLSRDVQNLASIVAYQINKRGWKCVVHLKIENHPPKNGEITIFRKT